MTLWLLRKARKVQLSHQLLAHHQGKSKKQSLSDDQIEKKIRSLVNEYCNIGDVTEAMACVKDLHSPEKHNLVVYHAVNGSLERSEKNREMVARLLKKMLHENLITTEDYFKG